MRTPLLLASALALAACGRSPRPAAQTPAPPPQITARAELRDAEGRAAGTLQLVQTPLGVLITGDVGPLPPGVHAMHVHETGRCEPPFTSAGGHFNPTVRAHGFRSPAGYHAGDLPNFTSPPSGAATRVDHFTRDVTLGTGPTSLLDADGSAIVIHAGPDDYASDPAGNSGSRIACGVVVR